MVALHGRLGNLDAVDLVVGMRPDFEGSSVARSDQPVGERVFITVAVRRRVIHIGEWASLSMMCHGLTVQHLGGTPAAAWALKLLQKNVWGERTRSSLHTQMMKPIRFAREEGQDLPPGEIGLVAYVLWLIYEGSVSANSFTKYLSAIRRYCEGE